MDNQVKQGKKHFTLLMNEKLGCVENIVDAYVWDIEYGCHLFSKIGYKRTLSSKVCTKVMM